MAGLAFQWRNQKNEPNCTVLYSSNVLRVLVRVQYSYGVHYRYSHIVQYQYCTYVRTPARCPTIVLLYEKMYVPVH